MKSVIHYISVIFIFMLFISCNRINFCKFDRNDITFQIIPKKEGILRARNTEGEGARKLQFFSSKGKLLDEITLHNEPFNISRWENDTIEIMFHISDYISFESWFKTNEYKPTKINNYNIFYSYRIIKETNQGIKFSIDSFHINKMDHRVSLFLKNKLVNTLPIEGLEVGIDRFGYEDEGNKAWLEYLCQDRIIIKKYMKEILKLY